jgi:hypothetical protein
MKITLQAFSSSGGSYPVEVSDENGVFRMFCHCQAGMTQQMCKHKIGFLKGDAKMLYNAAEKTLLEQIQSSPAFPAIKARLEVYEAALSDVEREMAKLKEKEKAIKRDFTYELTHGKPSPTATVKLQYDVKPRTEL